MTVKELYDELKILIDTGHADTRVIANCEFKITKGNGDYDNFYLLHLNDVYYQSGDIELGFSQEPNLSYVDESKKLEKKNENIEKIWKMIKGY